VADAYGGLSGRAAAVRHCRSCLGVRPRPRRVAAVRMAIGQAILLLLLLRRLLPLRRLGIRLLLLLLRRLLLRPLPREPRKWALCWQLCGPRRRQARALGVRDRYGNRHRS
jgi:hypothetical protein